MPQESCQYGVRITARYSVSRGELEVMANVEIRIGAEEFGSEKLFVESSIAWDHV